MGMFDWLSNPIGGYAEGPNPSGAAGVPQSNLTWGQLLGAVAGMSNSKSGQQIGSLMQRSFQMPQAQQPQNVFDQPYQSKLNELGKGDLTSFYGSDSGAKSTSIGEIMQIAAMFV